MKKNSALTATLMSLALVAAGCISPSVRHHSNALEYLYPDGVVDAPPGTVDLHLPLRVGIAFAPSKGDGLSEASKRELLKRVATAFEEVPDLQNVVILPSSSLTPKGGYDNLKGVADMNGVSLVALASFDQLQFDDQDRWSLLYWTIIGAYWIPADRHETQTLIDVSVFDVASRALLFTGSGSSVIKARSTATDAERVRREQSALGFEKATDDLISSLKVTAEVFREHARAGTVRGLGTPRVQVHRVAELSEGRSGTGAFGVFEVSLTLLVVLSGAAVRSRRNA